MNFKMIAAAAALLAAGAANAAISSFDGSTAVGNGSLVLLKLDDSTTNGAATQGLIADLGFNFSDFANGGVYGGANTKIVWDFSANTITKNGVLVTGVTNDWASQFAAFAANSDAADTKWTIASGSQKGTSTTGASFLLAGPGGATPTSGNVATMAGVDGSTTGMIKTLGTKGTITSADNGAYAMGSSDSSWLNKTFGATTSTGWKNASKWSVWGVDGDSTNLWQITAGQTVGKSLVGDSANYVLGAGEQLNTTGLKNGGGTFTLAGNQLIWQTATITAAVTPSVPEPESFALALVGVMGLVVARRRTAK